MNKKIIMSFLLILLITISISAISAADISTNDQNQLSSDESSIDEIAQEDVDKGTNAKSLGDGISTSGNNWNVKPSSDGTSDALSIQKAINSAYTANGDTILLSDKNFTLEKAVNINKDLTIKGGNIYNSKNLTDLFIIDSQSEGGPKTITITGSTFYVNGNENIVLANGENITSENVIKIADISITNCTIIPIDLDIDSNIENTVLLNVNSERTLDSAASTGAIKVLNNNLNGAKSLKNNGFYATDNIYIQKTEIVLNSILICPNITIETYDKNTNDTINYYKVTIKDQNGAPIANKTLQIGFNGKTYDRTTDENGIAKLKLSLAYSGVYTFATYFLGDEHYKSAFDVSTVTIIKKNSTISAPRFSYNVNAKTKTLTATLKDKHNKALANKKVSFTVNGKTYTGTTNSKGVASVKITLTKKGTYTYTAKFAGDNIYNSISKKGKLTLNPLASALTVKKYTFKRYATKKIQVTLKSGKSVLKSKKVTLKINGKTYSAKTNNNGVATITIKLTKKGTFKYTANFAGDNTYKAASKSNYAVIK